VLGNFRLAAAGLSGSRGGEKVCAGGSTAAVCRFAQVSAQNGRANLGHQATYPHDAKTPHDIIRQADEMMYLVKNTTRDNIGIAQRGVMK